MTLLRPSKSFATAFALGVGVCAPAFGQTNPGNTNISTGSGAGTSPGVNPGSSPSGFQIGNDRSGVPRPRMDEQFPPGSRIRGVNPGGGIDPVTGLPAALDSQPMTPLTQEEIAAIDAGLLNDVRKIQDPANRSMAMSQVAMSKIAAHQPGSDDGKLEEARIAVREGTEAAVLVKDRVTRDIRLTNLVRAGLTLADEQNREAKTNATEVYAPENSKPWTARRRFDCLKAAEDQRIASADLAAKIDNATLRSEMLFRVVDSASVGSSEIASEALRVDSARNDLRGMTDMINRMADRGLVFAANTSGRIDKHIWRDRSMVSIAMAAASSDQFNRGIEICRTIPQPEYRSDALIRLAEAQARRNLGAAATSTYGEAASAVASIPLADPRAVLASVLIDSLVSVGRFEDARECVPFYPDAVRRQNALGTIAETQGERHLTKSAYAWIDRDAPPELRDMLRMRVNRGVLKAFERSRLNAGMSDINPAPVQGAKP